MSTEFEKQWLHWNWEWRFFELNHWHPLTKWEKWNDGPWPWNITKCCMNERTIGKNIEQTLSGRLVDWFIGWLVFRLIDWWIGYPSGWLLQPKVSAGHLVNFILGNPGLLVTCGVGLANKGATKPAPIFWTQWWIKITCQSCSFERFDI